MASDNKGFYQIRLVYSNKGKVFRLDTKVKTIPIYWDAENQKILSRVKEIGQDARVLNDILTSRINYSTIGCPYERYGTGR